MAEPPKDTRAASLAALDDGWGDLLDAAPPPMPAASAPEPMLANDDAVVSTDDDPSAEDAIPLPTPVPLRTRVPTKPVMRGIREESQPIDVLTIVRDVEPSDGIPRPVVDDAVAEPVSPPHIEPMAAAESMMRLRAPVLAPIVLVDDASPPIVDDDETLPPIVADEVVTLPPIVDDEPAIAVVAADPPARTPVRVEPLARPMPMPAPPEPSGRRTLWFGASGVAALLVIGVVVTRPDAEPSPTPPAAQVAGASVHAAAPRDAAPAPAPARAVADAPPPSVAVPAPVAAPPVAPPAEIAAPSPVAVPPPSVAPTPVDDAAPTDTPVGDARAALDRGEFARAHELARAAFKIDRDNEAMRIMAVAACQLDDGALAREAYRSLAGPRTRSDVFTLCRERGVDVRAKTKGYTPDELLAKASRMAELGDPETAYDIARASNREHRSAAALELMGICACKMKSADKAGYVAGLVSAEAKKRIVDECTAAGVELPAEG